MVSDAEVERFPRAAGSGAGVVCRERFVFGELLAVNRDLALGERLAVGAEEQLQQREGVKLSTNAAP